MFYYEVNIMAIHRLGGRPRNWHKNFYNVEDAHDLALRLKNYICRNIDDDYEILTIGVSLVDNDQKA